MQVTEEDLKNMSPEEILELQKKNCIFCHIINGQVPSHKVYEDEKVIAVLDINPATKGHIILFTKEHYQIMPQIPDETIQYLFVIAKQLCKTILKSMAVKGTNIFMANGAVAGQKAPHFLVHIIPREENDGINLNLPKNKVSEQELEKIKAHLVGNIVQQPKQEKTEEPKKEENNIDLDKIAGLFN